MNEVKKLNLGCGNDIRKGWINLDKDEIDLEKKLPFPEKSVDVVLLREVIEHIRNHKQLLKEIYRILKTGGALFLTTPNYRSLRHRIALLFGKDYPWRDLNHVRFFTDKSILKELQQAGFCKIKLKGVSGTGINLPTRFCGNVKAWSFKNE